MQMSPVIAVHLTAVLAALVLGPIALWARRGHGQPGRSVTSRPRLHRAAGYAWVSMMLLAALSALFIRDFTLPNIAGYTPLHLLVPTTLVMQVMAFRSTHTFHRSSAMTDLRSPAVDSALDRLARRRAGAKMGWFIHAAVYAIVNLGLAALSLSAGRDWHAYPLLGWGLGLAIHGAAVWLIGPGAALRERLVERERAALARRGH